MSQTRTPIWHTQFFAKSSESADLHFVYDHCALWLNDRRNWLWYGIYLQIQKFRKALPNNNFSWGISTHKFVQVLTISCLKQWEIIQTKTSAAYKIWMSVGFAQKSLEYIFNHFGKSNFYKNADGDSWPNTIGAHSCFKCNKANQKN